MTTYTEAQKRAILKHRDTHRDQINAYRRQYYAANRERISSRQQLRKYLNQQTLREFQRLALIEL